MRDDFRRPFGRTGEGEDGVKEPKRLRRELYRRQCVILKINDGGESVFLPGDLIRLNPRLLK